MKLYYVTVRYESGLRQDDDSPAYGHTDYQLICQDEKALREWAEVNHYELKSIKEAAVLIIKMRSY